MSGLPVYQLLAEWVGETVRLFGTTCWEGRLEAVTSEAVILRTDAGTVLVMLSDVWAVSRD